MAKQSTANNVNFALHHAKSSPDNHFWSLGIGGILDLSIVLRPK
jgi:hypothetical protein